MKRALIISILLSGCAVSEYYAPQVEWQDRTTVSSCNNKWEIYQKHIADGIVLEIDPPSTIFLRIDSGKKVRLLSDQLIFFKLDSNAGHSVKIEKIVTGEFPEPYKTIYKIPEISYAPTSELVGLGRYKNVDVAWGEWSSFKGKEDIFMFKNGQFPFIEKEPFSIKIPPLTTGGVVVDIPKIDFLWKKGRSLGCAQ